MAKKRTNEIYRCHCCGVELSTDNCREVSSKFSQSGLSAYCVECESAIYNRFAQTQGKYHALLSACSAFNTPLKPILLDGVNLDEEPDAWITYATLLAESGQDRKNGKLLSFADGVTTLWGLFGNDLSQKDFTERIRREKEKLKKQIGTSEQIAKWGVSVDYQSQADYDELDRLYEARASAFKGQTITLQMETTLVNVAKWSFKMDKLLSGKSPNFHGAKALSDMIDKALASENMRKKDEKPAEMFRLDALITELEKAGCMENGDFLPYDELIEVLRDKFIKSKKYKHSLDVADQVILDVLNAMRKNADLLELAELPLEFAAVDEYGECEPEETEEEKKRKQFAQTPKVQVVDENGNPITEKKTATRKNSKKE